MAKSCQDPSPSAWACARQAFAYLELTTYCLLLKTQILYSPRLFKVCSVHSVTMKVLILVALVAVAVAKPAENSIQRLARSLDEDEVMKRGVISDVFHSICVPVMDSMIGLTNGGCDVVASSVESKCNELAEQQLGNFLSGLISNPFASMCKRLADIVRKECEKGNVQNLASNICAKIAVGYMNFL